MPIKFDLQMPDGQKLAKAFGRFSVEVEESVPRFLQQVSELLDANAEQEFATQGAHDGGTAWKPRAVISNLIRQQQGLDPGGPLLEGTGRLRAALTGKGGGALRALSGKSLVWGTQGIPYASYHQHGTRQRGVTPKQQRYLGMLGWRVKLGKVITMPARPAIDIMEGGQLRPIFRRHLTGAARSVLVKARQVSQLPVNWDREISRSFDLEIDAKE